MATKTQRQATKRNWKSLGDDIAEETSPVPGKKVRPCSRAGCPAVAPVCFVRAVNTCCGNGYTSRWYHLSAGEHYCNECFEYFYRSSKSGYDSYSTWKRMWSHNGHLDGGVGYYMFDQMLPYWAQCKLCSKWRQLFRETKLTAALLKKYVCTKVLKNETQEDACNIAEDFRVEELAKHLVLWSKQLQLKTFCHNALYAPCVRNFYQQSVGISPSDTAIHKYPDGITEIRPHLHPFQTSESNHAAMTISPHCLTEEESAAFPHFVSNHQPCYLIIRNTAIALWNMDVKKPVTQDRCMNHIIVRGMSRIWMYEHVVSVLHFLTLHSFINTGLISMPQELNYMTDREQQHPVIIIGGGIAGLSAARHLTNLGVKVKLLEARGQLGGRAIDQGSPINAGAMIVVGCHNNPMVILCKQADIAVSELGEHCVLLNEEGNPINEKLDKRMQFHFEAMLDINKQSPNERQDVSLLDRFNELHQQFKDESGIKFTKIEEGLLQFYMSNLEFACGSGLGNVSAKFWDQNEDYPQFSGPPIIIQTDLDKMVEQLAKDVDTETNTVVTEVDYSGPEVTVTCSTGQQYVASQVILSVPLFVFKNNKIKFTPALPDEKLVGLDCGNVEKVVLEFPERFWLTEHTKSEMFGRVVMENSSRGMLDVFYDMSVPVMGTFLLASYVTGDAVEQMKSLTDQQMVDNCVQTLQKLFPSKTVSQPTRHYVSRWYQEDHINMSYSFVPINSGPNIFDDLEKDVDQKIFFSGESMHKQFHQTLTGAYMSGLREAEKVYTALTS